MRSLEIEFGGPVLPLLLLATGATGSGSGCVPLPDAVFCDVLGLSSPHLGIGDLSFQMVILSHQSS